MQELQHMDAGRNHLVQTDTGQLNGAKDAVINSASKKIHKNENGYKNKNISNEYVRDNEKKPEVDREELDNVAQAMEGFINSGEWDLKIQIHEETDQTMVKIVSRENGEVIREIPSERLLDLAAEMKEMVGVLFNNKA